MIGRIAEQEKLKSKENSKQSEFIAVYGRRRVGKTYLIRETFKGRFTFEHSGIQKGGLKQQLEAFRSSLTDAGYTDCPRLHSWLEAFNALKNLIGKTAAKKKIVFIDEISWMDTPKSGFVPQLEFFWNKWASARKDILLIICGSATSWIIRNVFKNRGGLHNRTTGKIPVQPFTLKECEDFCRHIRFKASKTDICMLYMVMGGVAYYWSLLSANLSAAQNIDSLFFAPNAELSGEYHNLYDSLFKHPQQYKKIVEALGSKAKGLTRLEIIDSCGLTANGSLSVMLNELEQCGFTRSYTSFGKKKHGTLYQLIDNYTLFHFKFLAKNRTMDGQYWSHNIYAPTIRTWSGLAFEKTCLMHLQQIKNKLGIAGITTSAYSWRSEEYDHNGAQIDMIIDRADNVINICEIKWSSSEYAIDKRTSANLSNKIEAFIRETGTKKSVHLTMITGSGTKRNMYRNMFQSEVTLEDLFV